MCGMQSVYTFSDVAALTVVTFPHAQIAPPKPLALTAQAAILILHLMMNNPCELDVD